MTGNTQVILAAAVFLTAYAVIVSEKVHRTVAALAGAAADRGIKAVYRQKFIRKK